MEPERTSTLKSSYQEYEELGKQHRKVSSRIEKLQEAMKLSRQRGAFQELQTQMREVKDLVKMKEELDGKMAVADLARKKDDDHRLAVKQEVSYAEQLDSARERISNFESFLMSYSESNFDFALCQRPDGTRYGTRGSCVEPNREITSPPQAAGKPMSPAERAAYKAGGGNAAAMRGRSVAEVAEQGRRNLQRLDQGRGTSGMARSEADARRSGQPLTPAERAAYKAGGGDAAARRNKGGVDEAIDQGRRNLQRLDQGRGNFSEGDFDIADFARCQRPDGSFYGTRGKCKKGMSVGGAPAPEAKPSAGKSGKRKSVQEQREVAKKVLMARRQAERNAAAASKAAKATERETKGDNSLQARQRRAAAQKALEKAQALAERAAVASDRAFTSLARAAQRAERAKMSPKQRASERALEREIELRG